MKTLTRSLAALFFSLFLLACTDEERAVWPAVELSFSPAINASTRAFEGVYPADEPFTVWAFALPGDKRWDSNAADAAPLAEGCSVEFNGEGWVPVPAVEATGKQSYMFCSCTRGHCIGFLVDGRYYH